MIFRRVSVALLAVVMGSALWTASADATIMLYLSVDDLYEMSDVVVRGTIVSHRSFHTDEGQVHTDWTMNVSEVLLGEPRAAVTFRQYGGEIDGNSHLIAGDAQFREGEHIVLFLTAEHGILWPSALGQSVFAVTLEVPVPSDATGQVYEATVAPIAANVSRSFENIGFYRVTELGSEIYVIEELEVMTLDALREIGQVYVGGEQ